MIFELLVTIALEVVGGIVGFLPAASDLGLDGLGGWFVGYAWLDQYLPVSEVLVVLGLVTIVTAAVFAYGAAKSLLSWIPVLGPSE